MIDAAALGGGATTHPVLCTPAEVAAAAVSLLASTGASLTLAEVQGAYLELQAATAVVEAAALHLVRMLVEHERPHRRKAPGTQTRGWLERAARLGRGAATAEVAAARATDPGTGALRGLGAALAAGEVSRQHVDVAARVLPRLPQRVLDERRETVDGHLTGQARDFSPSDADTLVKHLRKALAGGPDGADGAGADDDGWPEPPAASHERRQTSWYEDWTGMTQIRISLPQDEAAAVIAALSGLSAPTRTPAGQGDDDDAAASEPEPDRRTTTQRRADAVTELVRRAQSAVTDAELEVGRLVVVATEAQLAEQPGAGGAVCTFDASPLSPHALRRCACDAVVALVVLDRHGAVVRMESVGRLANRAQRRALAARDGGCAFPGCSAPPSWCEAHHIVFWSLGGATVIANLVLLCSRHHTEVHLGHWTITVRDEVPWFVPPPWVDREQRPVRNSFHQQIAATRGVAAALRRVSASPAVPPPPPAAPRPPTTPRPRTSAESSSDGSPSTADRSDAHR